MQFVYNEYKYGLKIGQYRVKFLLRENTKWHTEIHSQITGHIMTVSQTDWQTERQTDR